MRHRIVPVLLTLAVVILSLSSCATSVSVDYYRPSEIDMGRYRTVAVASCVPFKGFHAPPFHVRTVDGPSSTWSLVSSGYTASLADDVADYATQSLLDKLEKTGFFSIIPPAVSDGLITLSRMGHSIRDEVSDYGIDAFIVPRITAMDVNEYISSDRVYVTDYTKTGPDGQPLRVARYRYYLTQTVSVVYSYTVIDAQTMTVYATRNFSDKAEYTTEISSSFFTAPLVMRYFRTMIDGITRLAAWQLAPSRDSLRVDLMKNKPKSEAAEVAYELVDDGALMQAVSIFRDCWETEQHLPSGYNWALLSATRGDLDGAVSILDDVLACYDSAEAEDLRHTLDRLRNLTSLAKAQMDGTGSGSNYTDASGSIFSVVMGE